MAESELMTEARLGAIEARANAGPLRGAARGPRRSDAGKAIRTRLDAAERALDEQRTELDRERAEVERLDGRLGRADAIHAQIDTALALDPTPEAKP